MRYANATNNRKACKHSGTSIGANANASMNANAASGSLYGSIGVNTNAIEQRWANYGPRAGSGLPLCCIQPASPSTSYF